MHIIEKIGQKSCLILGFGREGKSTYQFLRALFPEKPLTIADGNANLECNEYRNDFNCHFILGTDYLSAINQFELIVKTPGISLKDQSIAPNAEITSQTDIFLQLYGHQTIGTTGTKGKSTTTTLIHHILSQSLPNILLAGNMGIPLFDIVPKITPNSIIVCEFSSHQLEYLTKSPHISILLNLFEEHLDHYQSYLHYQLAKLNIATHQSKEDYFIYNLEDTTTTKLLESYKIPSHAIPFSTKETDVNCFYLNEQSEVRDNFFNDNDYVLSLDQPFPLKGAHNRKNMIAATIASILCEVSPENINKALKTFSPLPHRLEFVCTKNGIDFYNDSISTIPEATIEALNTITNTETLILGGFDRGIDYSPIIQHLITHPISNLIFTGDAGKRMMTLWEKATYKPKTKLFFEDEYEEIVRIAFASTPVGKSCVLSPAASSYDKFKNFEFRGDFFKELIYKAL